jgi:hypothetical protein
MFFFGNLFALQKSMQCIEVIRLRTRPEKRQEIIGWLLENAPVFRKVPFLREAIICNGLSASSDLGLVLEWEHFPVHAQGSDAAASITEGLRPFGLVDYTIWSVAGSVHPDPG